MISLCLKIDQVPVNLFLFHDLVCWITMFVYNESLFEIYNGWITIKNGPGSALTITFCLA